MTLSSAIGRNTKSAFPDCNQRGLKNLFTGHINPRVTNGKSKSDKIIILWYDLGLTEEMPLYKANHCVSLFGDEREQNSKI